MKAKRLIMDNGHIERSKSNSALGNTFKNTQI